MAKKNFVGAKGARLLRRVAKHILAEPLRYNQDEIVCRLTPQDDSYHGRQIPACKTIACIGGWLHILTAKRRIGSLESLPFRKFKNLLGIKESALYKLTAYSWNAGENGWPDRFRIAYLNTDNPKAKAEIAACRIEHFIKTGE